MPLVKLLHVIAWTDCLEKVKRGEWHKFFRSLVSSQVVQHDYKMVESLVEFQMHWRTIFKRFGFSLKFQFHAFPVRLFFSKFFQELLVFSCTDIFINFLGVYRRVLRSFLWPPHLYDHTDWSLNWVATVLQCELCH